MTADTAAMERAVRGGACAIASAAVVATRGRELGFARAFLGRDPDGHAFQVTER